MGSNSLSAVGARKRLLFVDNLRWTMIVLVISMHAADTYSPLGNWYFTDRSPLSHFSLLFFAAWQMYLQSFFMGLLFLVSGFFVPNSFDRKGPRRFIVDRGFRLGLPVLFYMFVLGPVTEYYVAHSWTSTKPTSMANEWIKHIRNGEFFQENGPLWFCLALLIFSLIYTLWRTYYTPERDDVDTAPPSNFTLVCFALVMATSTFLVRAINAPKFLNMPLGDFPQYILLFAAGVFAARKKWLLRLSTRLGVRWLIFTLLVGFPAWLGTLIAGGALEAGGPARLGGWSWQAGSICVWESFTCVAICFGLLVLFRDKFNSQGPLARFLSSNAFSVYVFHPPIVILAARILHGWSSVASIPKFFILTVVSAAASFGLSAMVFRRIPLLRTIL